MDNLKFYELVKGMVTVSWSNQVYDANDLIHDIYLKLWPLPEDFDLQVVKANIQTLIRAAFYQKIRPKLPIYNSQHGFDDLESMAATVGMPLAAKETNQRQESIYEQFRQALIDSGVDDLISALNQP
jgi:DNA-directed RNA polymerase specialized sigma24 family protein